MKRLIILVLALAGLVALFAACGDDEQEAPTATAEPEVTTVQGSGNFVVEEFALADFTAVHLESFLAEIKRSDSFSVAVRADDNVLELLDVRKEGDTLRLDIKPGVSLAEDVTLQAAIMMPELDGLGLDGAARVTISGFRSSTDLDIELAAASTLGGDVEAGNVDIEASDASNVALVGSATGLTIVGSGASGLGLGLFTVNTADVTLREASAATLQVLEQIATVDLSDTSRLYYWGDPLLGDVKTSDESTLEKMGD